LPYHGRGSGIKRALEEWPEIEFIDDHDGCLFQVASPGRIRMRCHQSHDRPSRHSKFGIRDPKRNGVHLNAKALASLGVTLDSAAKTPDVIVHHRAKNWLLLIEAVTSAGPVDGKRRKELKDLFAGCQAGLVFATAFGDRRTMQTFVSHIAWESEVWIADDPDRMIHFNGERCLGPYPDVMPPKP
jgi:hypothetical protein